MFSDTAYGQHFAYIQSHPLMTAANNNQNAHPQTNIQTPIQSNINSVISPIFQIMMANGGGAQRACVLTKQEPGAR